MLAKAKRDISHLATLIRVYATLVKLINTDPMFTSSLCRFRIIVCFDDQQ